MAVKEAEDSSTLSIVFSHSQTPIFSQNTQYQLAKPTGGKVSLTPNSQFMIHDKEQQI